MPLAGMDYGVEAAAEAEAAEVAAEAAEVVVVEVAGNERSLFIGLAIEPLKTG